jgi:hypothetical protein
MLENLSKRDHYEDLGLNETIILKWIVKKWNGIRAVDLSGSEQIQVAEFYECDNEPSNSIECGKISD